ncbi:MAG: hypothetical protein TREMPRED_003094 [Tremellales sp. Tagirdzhanova-0007]|nr:MAG: hypothetical protein TREMPRED_003094 [Tremellales sp. Tagirdzhanova-0007]
MRLAILDDYQGLSTRLSDWSAVSAQGVNITVFQDTIHDEDALAKRLSPFEIICTMRERTPFPQSLLDRLPNLKLLTTNGGRNRSLPFSTPSLRVFTARSAPLGQSGGDNTLEHCWALILALTKGIVDSNDRIQRGKAGQPTGVSWQGETNMGLRGKTLGIVGFGRLGQGLLPVARAFGLRLLVWSQIGRAHV